MLSRSEILAILQQRGFRPLKQFGQNFLADANLCRLIVDALPTKENDAVLEIGPGLGCLTRLLMERKFNVTVIEIDHGFSDYLREVFAEEKKFTLIENDALEVIDDLPKIDYWIGNLPYNVSSPIIAKLLQRSELPLCCVFMFQKEIAQRFLAKPRTKDYGALTIFLQNYYDIELVKKIPSQVFFPKPDVESIVIRLNRKSKIDSAIFRAGFYEFLRQGFSHRRKKLKSVLNLDLDQRAEELDIHQWHELYEKHGRHI